MTSPLNSAAHFTPCLKCDEGSFLTVKTGAFIRPCIDYVTLIPAEWLTHFSMSGNVYHFTKVTVQEIEHTAALRPLTPWEGQNRWRLSIFTWVINPSLNDIIQSKSAGCLFAPQPLVHARSQDFGHMIVVFAEVWVLLLRGEFHLPLVSVTGRHGWSLRQRMEKGHGNSRAESKAPADYHQFVRITTENQPLHMRLKRLNRRTGRQRTIQSKVSHRYTLIIHFIVHISTPCENLRFCA